MPPSTVVCRYPPLADACYGKQGRVREVVHILRLNVWGTVFWGKCMLDI